MKFAFVHAEKASFPVALMCRHMKVSRAGYYAWIGRSESERTNADRLLAAEIAAVHEESRRRYGAPRVHEELRALGRRVGRKRVARLMREQKLAARRRRRFVRTTDSTHSHPVAPNVLERNFSPPEPKCSWVGDITYIWTAEGWLYLAILLDLFSRRVVGWATSEKIDSELVLSALGSALHGERNVEGLMHHSDRGSQYASAEYQRALDGRGIWCSMSRKGNCWDNAVAESFFSSLKMELVHDICFMSRAEAKAALFEYIEVFYNRKRRHSSLGYVSPLEYERIANSRKLAA